MMLFCVIEFLFPPAYSEAVTGVVLDTLQFLELTSYKTDKSCNPARLAQLDNQETACHILQQPLTLLQTSLLSYGLEIFP